MNDLAGFVSLTDRSQIYIGAKVAWRYTKEFSIRQRMSTTPTFGIITKDAFDRMNDHKCYAVWGNFSDPAYVNFGGQPGYYEVFIENPKIDYSPDQCGDTEDDV